MTDYRKKAESLTPSMKKQRATADKVTRAVQKALPEVSKGKFSVAEVQPTGSYARKTTASAKPDVDMEVLVNGK